MGRENSGGRNGPATRSEAAAAKAYADGPRGNRNRATDFDEHLAAVQQIDLAVRQCGIGEHTVDEHENERGKDQVVELPPQWASHAQAKERGDDDDQQRVKRGCSHGY